MHSESALVQAQAIALFTRLGNQDNLNFALRHKAIIDRFGRYPRRNAILGRASSAEELAFLSEPGLFFRRSPCNCYSFGSCSRTIHGLNGRFGTKSFFFDIEQMSLCWLNEASNTTLLARAKAFIPVTFVRLAPAPVPVDAATAPL